MTHDELLAKMNKEVEMAEFESACGDGNDPRVAKALRAVVELHQSVELEPDGYPIVFCKNCFDDAGYQEPYPCQTIQTIEKELM